MKMKEGFYKTLFSQWSVLYDQQKITSIKNIIVCYIHKMLLSVLRSYPYKVKWIRIKTMSFATIQNDMQYKTSTSYDVFAFHRWIK